MQSICFFNHFHNGDLYHSKPFVKDVMNQVETDFYYFHSKDHKILKDLNIKRAFVEGLNQNVQVLNKDDFVFVNTWIGSYFNKYKGECTLNFNMKMWNDIYQELNEILGTNLKIKSIENYYPFVDFNYYILDNVDDYVYNNTNRKILISNGPGLSGQCEYNGDMADIIIELAEKHKNKTFITTQRIVHNKTNIVCTEDIIKSDTSDLNEISYLSTFCDLIIGKNSGPFCFSFNCENINDPSKTFIAFGTNKNDCFLDDIDIKCKLIFEKFTTINKLKETIEHQITKMENSPCVTICEYEDGTKTCKGCGRNEEEITEWSTATKERKREINKAARLRKSSKKE